MPDPQCRTEGELQPVKQNEGRAYGNEGDGTGDEVREKDRGKYVKP